MLGAGIPWSNCTRWSRSHVCWWVLIQDGVRGKEPLGPRTWMQPAYTACWGGRAGRAGYGNCLCSIYMQLPGLVSCGSGRAAWMLWRDQEEGPRLGLGLGSANVPLGCAFPVAGPVVGMGNAFSNFPFSSMAQIDMLQAEVTALKTLVITSTPSSPNRELHPQLQSPTKAVFRKGHGRNKSTSSAVSTASGQSLPLEPVNHEYKEVG